MTQTPKSPHNAPLTYADAGVDIEAGNEAVRRIMEHVASTRRPEQLSTLGGFAGAIELPAGYQRPVLVSCTDGVGTKLLVAIAMGRHNTVGIDLVAMNVNDLLVTGAKPLFLLDYIATGKLAPDVIEKLVEGIAAGCRAAGCSLLGGETAELPDMYQPGHYDLAACAVGVVEYDGMLGPKRVGAGDVVIALPSSGLHSNGYSLARRALLHPDYGNLALTDDLPGEPGRTVGAALLEPTRIYARAFEVLTGLRPFDAPVLHAAAHITGGGLLENPPRAYSDDLAVALDLSGVPRPALMDRIAELGVQDEEMRRTFNCGVGMLLFVEAGAQQEVIDALRTCGEQPVVVGEVTARRGAAVEFLE